MAVSPVVLPHGSSNPLAEMPAIQSFPPYQGLAMVDFWTEAKGGHEHRMAIIGHRGCGKNKAMVEARPSIMENTILSFNTAAWVGADFIEFDVQVTKDGHPIIFHDDLIVVQEQEGIASRRISDLTLEEFLSIGYQRGPNTKVCKSTLLREEAQGDGSRALKTWSTTLQDPLCSLEEVFQHVLPSVGFNIELKFDDHLLLPLPYLRQTVKTVLKTVEQCGMGRKMYFSSFHPDAALILRQEQSTYPVFFLTNGGSSLYNDPRRNSIAAAIEVCQAGGLQGIVSEVKAILGSPEKARHVKEAGLSLVTYGELNNLVDAFQKQEEMGDVDGVIVDHVLEIVVESRNPKHQPRVLDTNNTIETTLSIKAAA